MTDQPSTPTSRLQLSVIMRYGMILGILMSAQTLSVLLYPLGGFSTLIYMGLFFAIPIAIVQLGIHYRRNVLNDHMLYREGVAVLGSILVCAFIPLIISIYIVCSVLLTRPETLEVLQQSVEMLSQRYPKGSAEAESVKALLYITPRQATLQSSIVAFFCWQLYVYIAALIIKKR